jgi:hypothetical protein
MQIGTISTKATDPLNLVERAELDGGLMAAKGSANSARVGYALDDSAAVEAIEAIFRDHLLAALSEARSMSLSMDGNVREKLMDDLSKHFHPDGTARDLFSDAFGDARRMVADRVELVAAE